MSPRKVPEKVGAAWKLLFLALLAVGSANCMMFNGRPVVQDTSNYWDQETRTIHVAPEQSIRVYWHEWCHGWQGETLPDSDVGLDGWKSTPAGREFNGTLEQAADVCAYTMMGLPLSEYYSRWDYLVYIDPTWQAWAERWVACLSDSNKCLTHPPEALKEAS